jgi:hypothetical protein
MKSCTKLINQTNQQLKQVQIICPRNIKEQQTYISAERKGRNHIANDVRAQSGSGSKFVQIKCCDIYNHHYHCHRLLKKCTRVRRKYSRHDVCLIRGDPLIWCTMTVRRMTHDYTIFTRHTASVE